MKTGPLFQKLLDTKEKIIVLQGGGDAGKTVTALQYVSTELTFKRNMIATVVGQTVPNLKAGALRSFERYVQPDFARYIQQYNSTERTYWFRKKGIMEFKSFQDELGARGSERDILFMNECNTETWDTFWQLQRKTRYKIILDYNPTSRFWVHDKLLSGGDPQFAGKVKLFIVDHRHNPFLSDEEHESYELISDPDMFQVYSRGRTGKIKGLVFGHFKEVADWGARQDYDRVAWGLDYGYTNDPTTLVKVGIAGNRRVGKECCYDPGISATSLRDLLVGNGFQQQDVVYSENDPNIINELRLMGLPVVPAIKGPGSVAAGISKVRQHECYVTSDSANFKREINTYKFLKAQDIVSGKEITTNVPVDAWNHCCDAFRYADYTDFYRHYKHAA